MHHRRPSRASGTSSGSTSRLHTSSRRSSVGLFQGDLGTSINLQRPVSEIIGPRIGPSVLLLTYGMVISLLVALPLGVISALHRNRPLDHGIRVVATIGLAMPAFWFGLLLVEIFSLHLHLLPVAGYGSGFFGHLKSLTLPAITRRRLSRALSSSGRSGRA